MGRQFIRRIMCLLYSSSLNRINRKYIECSCGYNSEYCICNFGLLFNVFDATSFISEGGCKRDARQTVKPLDFSDLGRCCL